jgi:CheY-like chemotaxis protein
MPRILVADDSKVIQRVAERFLTAAGFEVALVSDGQETLSWLARDRVDLILSDINMPGRTGYEICQFVRSQPELSGTPLLLMSGFVDDEVTRQAAACLADGVLKKPLDGSSLTRRVSELLSRPHAPPALQGSEAPPPPAVPDPPSPRVGAAVGGPQRSGVTTAAPGPSPDAGPSTAEVADGALQAFQRTIANLKRLEAELAEERARSAALDQQLAAARQDAERVLELESLLDQEQAKSATYLRRLQDAERDLADTRARSDALNRAMAEITRLAGQV